MINKGWWRDQNQMWDNNLGETFQDKKEEKKRLSKVLGRRVSENEFKWLTDHKSTIDEDVSAHIRELSKKTGLEKAIYPEKKGVYKEYKDDKDYTDLGLLEIDLNEGYKSLKAHGLIPHGPIKSKDPIITAWKTLLVVNRHRNLLKPTLRNTNVEEMENGINILRKNFHRGLYRKSGEKISSFKRVKFTSSLAFLNKCFVDEFIPAEEEEVINDFLFEKDEVLLPNLTKVAIKNPKQLLEPVKRIIFKDLKIFLIIYAMRRVEKKRDIKILKDNTELMKILGMSKSTFYRNLKQIQSIFLIVFSLIEEAEEEPDFISKMLIIIKQF